MITIIKETNYPNKIWFYNGGRMNRFNFCLFTFFIIICSFFADIFAKVDIKFNGDVQYRLRFHYAIAKNVEGNDSSAAPDYSNRYAWNLKWKINVNENLRFGIRLSNPSGYASDNVAENLKWVTKRDYDVDVFNMLALPELYFNWSVGIFSLSAGIIPVYGNTALNLAAYETSERSPVSSTKLGYKDAGKSPWKVLTNNSQKGLNLGFKFLDNKETSVGMNVITSIASDAPITDKYDAFQMDQFRFIASFPVSMMEKKLFMLPVIHARLNTFRASDYEHADHSVVGGCDIVYKPVEALGIMVGGAGGTYNNECQIGDSVDTDSDNNVDTPISQISPLGVLLNSCVTLSPGFGKASVFFAFSQARDREATAPLNNNLLHWDIKYSIPIKSLTVLPRMRIWHYTKEDAERTKTELRPELILKAKF